MPPPLDHMIGREAAIATKRTRYVLHGDVTFSSNTLPDPDGILDELFDEADSPKHPVSTFTASGAARIVWPMEPSMLEDLVFTLNGGDGSTADVILGRFIPVFAPGKRQYIPRIEAVLALVAGSRTGVADGIVDASDYYADTVTESASYRYGTNPQVANTRIWGPKDATGVLSPNNTPSSYGFDALGGSYGFAYVKQGVSNAATGIKVLSFVA